MSKQKEFYEANKGKEITIKGRKCIVCGYLDDEEEMLLIAAYIDDSNGVGYMGWTRVDIDDVILTHQNNQLGYCYVDEEDL